MAAWMSRTPAAECFGGVECEAKEAVGRTDVGLRDFERRCSIKMVTPNARGGMRWLMGASNTA